MRANQLVKCAGFIAATIVVFYSCINVTFSQLAGAAVPFLIINPSPEGAGMGGSSAVLPSDDPYAFAFNPAQLGFLGKNNNLAFSFYPSKIDWLPPQFNSDIGLSNYALTFGYDASGYYGLPLKIGAGLMYQYMNLGEYTKTAVNGTVLGKFQSNESAFTTSFGFCFDYFIDISGGISIKYIHSKLTPVTPSQPDAGKADDFAFDFGILASLPIFESHPLSDNLSLNLNVSAGYTLVNFGPKITYEVESDPLPRTARIGLGISGGLDMKYNNGIIPAVKVDLVSEADNSLVNHYMSGATSYKNILGDINIWDNVFMLKSSGEGVINFRGIQLSLFDILSFRTGQYDIFAYLSLDPTSKLEKLSYNTFGYSIKASGILQIIKPWYNNDIVNYMAKHIDLGYTYANYGHGRTSFDLKYRSVVLRFKGFEI